MSIGPDNFIGNLVAYPSQGRTGANCLLATMVMVPVEGDVREGTGLLGSPSFEIPRSVLRDSQFDHLSSASELPRRLAAKNRHNLVTMGLFLFVHWMHLFALPPARTRRPAPPRPVRRFRDRAGRRGRARVHGRLLRASGTRLHLCSGRSSLGTARSTTRTSGFTSATGSSWGRM